MSQEVGGCCSHFRQLSWTLNLAVNCRCRTPGLSCKCVCIYGFPLAPELGAKSRKLFWVTAGAPVVSLGCWDQLQKVHLRRMRGKRGRAGQCEGQPEDVSKGGEASLDWGEEGRGRKYSSDFRQMWIQIAEEPKDVAFQMSFNHPKSPFPHLYNGPELFSVTPQVCPHPCHRGVCV